MSRLNDDRTAAESLREQTRMYVNRLLMVAVSRGISEIHIVFGTTSVAVTYQVDGQWEPTESPANELPSRVLKRLRSMAGIDGAVIDRSQNGTIDMTVGQRTFAVAVRMAPVAEGFAAWLNINDLGNVEEQYSAYSV